MINVDKYTMVKNDHKELTKYMLKIDYKKYINIEEFNKTLEKCIGKKIICFGAGTATYLMPRILPTGYKVDYYIDSNARLWGESPLGPKICSPETVLQEEEGSYIILIVSQHALSMRKQLESYGLVLDVDYIDLFTSFEKCFRIQKVVFQAEKLIEFINKIPIKSFLDNPTQSNQKIGVVAACGFMGTPMFYDIGIFLLMRYNGYDVELIMDNTYTCENFTMYEGASSDIREITDQVINIMLKRFPQLLVKWIDESKTCELVENDIKYVERQARINTIWQKSRQNDRSMNISQNELEKKFYKVFLNNLKSIKCFFEKNSYDILTVSTALHYHRGFYMWMGECHNMRVANYDGSNNDGKTSWGTNYPNGHHYDIAKLINDNYFNEIQKQKIIELAKADFNRRRYSVSDGSNYNYQLVASSEVINEKWSEVVIPLNVMWDAAAIGLNRVFSTEEEWLVETINYVLKNTCANIMIREHPVQMNLDKYNNANYEKLLYNNFGDNPRIKLYKYNEKINTYDFIKNCKVVLPLSSTVGLESVFLGKPVVVHSNCYYSKLNFVKAASNKEEYFSYIRQSLDGSIAISQEMMDEAYLAYFILMNSRIKTIFSESNPEWLMKDIEELNDDITVQRILDSIGKDIPIPYVNILDIIEKNAC